MIVAPPTEIRRIVFFGTPDAAVPPLRALHAAGYDIALVVSQPDRRRGRGAATVASPVKAAALELGIPVSDAVDDALATDADLGVVVAFGQLIRPHVLERLAMVNIHFSLLPRWRGAAPVERAILAGDRVTGVCLMVLDHELDVGDVYRRSEVPIQADDTAETLRARLVEVGTELLVSALHEGLEEPEPQVGEPVWAHKIAASELQIDWSRPADEIDRLVRVGGAWTTVDGRRLKIWRARAVDPSTGGPGAPGAGTCDGTCVRTGAGTLELIEVQPEGKPRRDAAEWARGARLPAGTVLGVTT